eukprot:5311458-Amphidinium_carterae.2
MLNCMMCKVSHLTSAHSILHSTETSRALASFEVDTTTQTAYVSDPSATPVPTAAMPSGPMPSSPPIATYSPAQSPVETVAQSPAETTDSSTTSESTVSGVDLSQLAFGDAFELLPEHMEKNIEDSTKWWKDDCMRDIYMVHAMPWAELVQNRASVHELTASQSKEVGEDRSVVYIHSSVKARLEKGESLGRRFASAVPCNAHSIGLRITIIH